MDDFHNVLIKAGLLELVITSKHAATLPKINAVHKDPFDKMLMAQAFYEKIPLVTVDELIISSQSHTKGLRLLH